VHINKYDVTIHRVIDGDTVDVDINLGFGVWLTDERVRVSNIDCPESRTRDKVEDLFGEAAKSRVIELLTQDNIKLTTKEDRKGQDMKGKFGRVLGDFELYYHQQDRWCTLSDILILEGHAVAYFGGNKEEMQAKHMINRKKLLREGIIAQADYDAAVKLMEDK